MKRNASVKRKTPILIRRIHDLRGKYKGTNLLQALADEKLSERNRELAREQSRGNII